MAIKDSVKDKETSEKEKSRELFLERREKIRAMRESKREVDIPDIIYNRYRDDIKRRKR